MTMALDADFDPRTALQRAAALKRKFRNPPNAKPDHGINIKNGKPVRVEPPSPPSPKGVMLPDAEVEGRSLSHLVREAIRIEDAIFECVPIAEVLRRDENTPSLYAVQCVVAAFYGLTRDDLISQRRTRRIARPRQVAMFLASIIARKSTTYIGFRFGGRDHSTAVHAINITKLRAQTDERIRNEIQLLTTRIYERCGIEQPREEA
jgi:hypothetical protein